MVIKKTMEQNETFGNLKIMDNLTEPTKREAVYNHEQGKFVFLSILIWTQIIYILSAQVSTQYDYLRLWDRNRRWL